MKLVLACLVLCAGCGFGDNLALTTGRGQCGDGKVGATEGCDDGNTIAGDGCSETCAVETSNPVCGNAVREVGEACDDGNTTAGDGCSPACMPESVCGNHAVEANEQCDDGNTLSGDGCSPTCKTEAADACTLLPQGGCSGGTPACDLKPIYDGSTECRAVTSMGTSNNHCLTGTECAKGYTCVDDLDGEGVCSRFCAVDSDCLGTGSRCVIELVDLFSLPINVSVCSNACDPYGQSGCPTNMGCIPVNATDGDYTDCRYQSGDIANGMECDSSLDCLEGSMCVGSSGTYACRAICIVGNTSSCTTGTCTGFSNPLTIGTVTYGACI